MGHIHMNAETSTFFITLAQIYSIECEIHHTATAKMVCDVSHLQGSTIGVRRVHTYTYFY